MCGYGHGTVKLSCHTRGASLVFTLDNSLINGTTNTLIAGSQGKKIKGHLTPKGTGSELNVVHVTLIYFLLPNDALPKRP